MELGGANYVFDEKNNYEGLGDIATIDMVNPKDNAIITARGMGKPTATGGATLMENIIDIVDDYLTVRKRFYIGSIRIHSESNGRGNIYSSSICSRRGNRSGHAYMGNNYRYDGIILRLILHQRRRRIGP